MKTAKELHEQAQLGETHKVQNVATELSNYNLFTTDAAMVEAVKREGGHWGFQEIAQFGHKCGQAAYLELGHLANKYTPELDTHDRFGNRVDAVRYHSAYHALMESSLNEGIHSAPWTDPKAGAHVVRGAKGFIQSQVEAGHGCPVEAVR